MARRVAFRKKKNNRIGMACVSIVVIALFVVLMVRGVSLRDKVNEYERQEANIQKMIDAETKRASDLIEYEKYTKTDKYIEEIAKEKLGLVYEDEIIFKSEIEK